MRTGQNRVGMLVRSHPGLNDAVGHLDDERLIARVDLDRRRRPIGLVVASLTSRGYFSQCVWNASSSEAAASIGAPHMPTARSTGSRSRPRSVEVEQRGRDRGRGVLAPDHARLFQIA
jgi:hypothetical protein